MIRRSHFIPALGIVTLLMLSQQASAGSQDLRRPAATTIVAAQAEPGGTLTFSPAAQTINQRDTVNRVRSSASIASSLTTTTTFTVTVGPSGTLTFAPITQTINVGDSVNWVWASGFHSTTSGSCSGGVGTPDGKWDSTAQFAPFSFSFPFNTPGTYPYYCSVHCSLGMKGTIVVTTKLFLPLILK